ncbi:hypothetical protein AK830_g1303 [Neonectria ditissima]|uniref:Acetylesterase n=1 Tax=Neonectria ditissima TaxID=78410 RepID=A0A0P7C035_9HYPO|nr:hypothetical protein AK830_g1303 [Neonectria ditissima]
MVQISVFAVLAGASAFLLPLVTAVEDVKYFISFGDSYSQTGFDVTSTQPSAANPLGNPSLPGWTASGGLNWVGFMVTEFNTSLTLSYNFAYGGATVDADLVKPYADTVLSLIDQVEQFSNSIADHPAEAPWTSDNTIVGIWMGVNDVGNSYYLDGVSELLVKVVDAYFEQLQILYDAGVRNFALLTMPPTNLTPLMIAQGEASNKLLVAAIDEFNELLQSKLEEFNDANEGVTSKITDTAAAFNKAVEDPEAYGALDATCYNSDGVSCLWFNDYHPAVAIEKLVAAQVANDWDGFF